MSWLEVEVTETGDDIVAALDGLRAALGERIRKGAEDAMREWRQLVVRSTWFHPRPSPEGQIITRLAYGPEGVDIEYGWLNYRGDAAKATARAELRQHIFLPILGECLSAAIGGTP